MAKTAHIVVDLGFGDSGKGLVTDHLVRKTNAGLVVRFNGGAQAGHNVVAPDGRHHTFAQFGAGTLVPGTKTFLSRNVVVHPTAMLFEETALQKAGVTDAFSRLYLSEEARVITPFHQSMNRLRENLRGDARHGSCGVGVGETVKDDLDHPDDTLRVKELRKPLELKQKLGRVRERKRQELRDLMLAAGRSSRAFESTGMFDPSSGLVEEWLLQCSSAISRANVVPDEKLSDLLNETESVVFEGAQGVLIDENFGFHPHTSWSTCTFDPALALLRAYGREIAAERIGVMRAYAVRHGVGPLPTENPAIGRSVFEHNAHNIWQGSVRYGGFDAVLARYGLRVVGGVDRLIVTHLDAVTRLPEWTSCAAYEHARDLAIPKTLDDQAKLTNELASARPIIERSASDEQQVLSRIEALLDRRIDFLSRGPTADDVVAR